MKPSLQHQRSLRVDAVPALQDCHVHIILHCFLSTKYSSAAVFGCQSAMSVSAPSGRQMWDTSNFADASVAKSLSWLAIGPLSQDCVLLYHGGNPQRVRIAKLSAWRYMTPPTTH